MIRPLKTGGMGAVWLAEETTQAERKVAVKVPLLTEMDDRSRQAEIVKRFRDERRYLAELSHEHIVPVLATGEIDGPQRLPYFVMPYLPTTLADRLQPHGDRLSGEWLPAVTTDPADLGRWLPGIADALAYLNGQHLLHRDIKPNNILFDEAGKPYLGDVGIIRDLERTGSFTRAGALDYMAPEVIRPARHIRVDRADQFSLAVTVFESLTGRKDGNEYPVPSGQFWSGDPTRWKRVYGVLHRALADDPEARFPDCNEFASTLVTALSAAEGPAAAESEARKSPEAVWHGKVAGSAAAAFLVAIVAVGIHLRSWTAEDGTTPVTRSEEAFRDPSPDHLVSPAIPEVNEPVAVDANQGRQTAPRQEPTGVSVEVRPAVELSPSEPDAAGLPNMEWVRVEAGTFRMGLPEGGDELAAEFPPLEAEAFEDARPVRTVRLTRPFYVTRTEVTIGQFRVFANENELPSGSRQRWDSARRRIVRAEHVLWDRPGWDVDDSHPVVNVSWHDAKAFCDWLSLKTGRNCRLPSEAEWEYACRGGTTSRFASGDGASDLRGYSNLADAALRNQSSTWPTVAWDDGAPFTAPSGRLSPNPFGLHDMHGNVWEWCNDLSDPEYYSGRPSNDVDPEGPPNESVGAARFRVIRGGSWSSPAGTQLCGYRNEWQENSRAADIGFRVLCEVDAP